MFVIELISKRYILIIPPVVSGLISTDQLRRLSKRGEAVARELGVKLLEKKA
jgi:hypothetical protein